MQYFCPVCDDILLCHLQQHKISWFCIRCRQEMPNFNLIERDIRQNDSLRGIVPLNPSGTSLITRKTNNKNKIINKQSNLLDSVISEGRKRLEIVSFILDQINYIPRHGFVELERDTTQKKYQLKDSEIIILYICQAILAHDISVLNNQHLQQLKATYAKLNISVEQIVYFIHLIKTSVLDFLHSTTFDTYNSESSQVCCLDTEVSNYFDVVIASII